MNQYPIFIGGLQRSGTSLLRSIVGSHPEIAIYQWDLPLWTIYYDKYKAKETSLENALSLLSEIFDDSDVKESLIKVDKNLVKSLIIESKEYTPASVFKCFLLQYAQVLNKPRWGLKTPHNEFFAEQIFKSYPNARFIQLIRDPRDVAVSFRSYNNSEWYYNSLIHINLWKESFELAMKNKNKWPGAYDYITYENLVMKPEKSIKKVCNILNIDYDSEMLKMKGHAGWKGSNSFFNDVKNKGFEISTEAIGRFKTKLEKPLIYLYQKELKRELESLNYPFMFFSKMEENKLKKEIQIIKFKDGFANYKMKIINLIAKGLKNTLLYKPSRGIYRMLIKSTS